MQTHIKEEYLNGGAMDAAKSREIIGALANGINPYTGEEFPLDSPYQHPQTIRALFLALQAFSHAKAGNKRHHLPEKFGKPWTREEDDQLLTAFANEATMKALAEAHHRTEGSIHSRLVKHGMIPAYSPDAAH